MQERRSQDAELELAVISEFGHTPGLTSDHIRVTVEDGAVTLAGQVCTHPEKALAEAAALRVPGVNAVAEEIAVRTTASLSDSAIAAEASQALERTVGLPPDLVKATVHDGWITLAGVVSTHFQRDVAERAVRHLAGISGIRNDVTIQTAATAEDLKAAITEALERNADAEAARIVVTVDAGVVTLNGIVQSWTERQQACSAAWSAPGVTNVENHLRVAN